MSTLQLLPVLKQRFFDDNGDPLAFGKLYSYIAGTSTPLGTYQDADGGTSNTNPIILDANGEANVFILPGGGAYKFVLADEDDNIQWTVDEVTVSSLSSVSGWTTHNITDGQAAAVLTGETVDLSLYSSAIYDCEIIRGTTVISNYGGGIAIQSLNGTGRVMVGLGLQNEDHGVTFSVSQVASVVTLKAAASVGPGNGTIKLSRRLISV